jgi:hypothetical protein
MRIIRLALSRPYTFVVAALLLLLVTSIRTPTGVLPSIITPVSGLPLDASLAINTKSERESI